jgi:hypothetical protein
MHVVGNADRMDAGALERLAANRGIGKAFMELKELGLIRKIPRLATWVT